MKCTSVYNIHKYNPNSPTYFPGDSTRKSSIINFIVKCIHLSSYPLLVPELHSDHNPVVISVPLNFRDFVDVEMIGRSQDFSEMIDVD